MRLKKPGYRCFIIPPILAGVVEKSQIDSKFEAEKERILEEQFSEGWGMVKDSGEYNNVVDMLEDNLNNNNEAIRKLVEDALNNASHDAYINVALGTNTLTLTLLAFGISFAFVAYFRHKSYKQYCQILNKNNEKLSTNDENVDYSELSTFSDFKKH